MHACDLVICANGCVKLYSRELHLLISDNQPRRNEGCMTGSPNGVDVLVIAASDDGIPGSALLQCGGLSGPQVITPCFVEPLHTLISAFAYSCD